MGLGVSRDFLEVLAEAVRSAHRAVVCTGVDHSRMDQQLVEPPDRVEPAAGPRRARGDPIQVPGLLDDQTSSESSCRVGGIFSWAKASVPCTHQLVTDTVNA